MTPEERASAIVNRYLGKLPDERSVVFIAIHVAIRAAIASETERCAKIAQDYHERIIKIYGATDATRGDLDASADIAKAIRKAPADG